MKLELDKLKQSVSADSPSGSSQEYAPLYLELDTLALGVPPSQMGDSVIEGKDPDWRQLQKNCLELWQNTRDLRLATYLAIAGLALDGLQGFADGLELIRYLLAERWADFWPQLDPDDDNDPLERLNIISMISPPPGAYDDPLHFLTMFRNQRLVPSGPRYTLRDLMLAEGELESEMENVDLSLLKAEMSGVPLAVMEQQRNLVDQVVGLLEEISQLFESHTEDYGLAFVQLLAELKRLKRFYAEFALMPSAESPVTEEVAAGEAEKNSPVQNTRGTFTNINEITVQNRAEALMLLRKSSEYFQQAEPNSPVPFLVNRALRMAEMNFMDLLGEIDPNAIERGRDILGVKMTEDD